MSEIIFPHDIIIPAEIDFENPIASELISNGVGIFLTTDNLATVTNIVTNVLGVPSDITTNELGIESNGIRMGTDISSLSTVNQTEISSNPYQLFKTQEDVLDEHYLKLSDLITSTTDAAQGVEVSGLVSATTIRVEIELADTPTQAPYDVYIADSRRTQGNSEVNSGGNGYFYLASGVNLTFGGDITNPTLNGVALSAGASGGSAINNASRGDVIAFDVSATSTLMFFARFNAASQWRDASIATLKVIDDNGIKFWDFNQSTGQTVIDHYTGSVATLINMDDSNWQRFVPVDIYTVGVDKDYETLALLKAGLTNTAVINRVIVYGNIPDVGDVVFGGGLHLDFHAGDNVFDGQNFSTNYHFNNVHLRGGHGCVFSVTGIKGYGVRFSNYGVLDAIHINSCMFNGGQHNTLVGATGATTDLTIKNSHIYNYRSHVSERNIGRYYNSVLGNIGGYATSAGLVAGEHAVNCIGFSDSNAYNPNIPIFGAGVTGSNNVSKDTSAADLLIGTGSVDFTGAFVDDSTGDYRINQAWADTNLVGNGWNNSNIASWAYYTAVVVPGPSGDISYDVNSLTFSSSGSATIPQPSGNASIDFDSESFNISGSASLPYPISDITFSIDKPVVFVDASATLPQPVSNTSFDIETLTFLVDGSATLPNPVGNVGFSIDRQVFTATGEATLPFPQSNIAFDVTKQTFTSTGSITLPQPIGDTLLDIQKLTFSGSGSASIQQNSSDVLFDLPSVLFDISGSVTNPSPFGSALLDIDSVSFTSTGSATLPYPQGTAVLTVDTVVFDASASITLPQPLSTVVLDIATVSFESTGSATLPQPNSSVSFELNSVDVVGTGTVTLPYPQSTISFSIQSATFLASGDVIPLEPSSSIDLDIPAVEFYATASVTLPLIVGDVSFDIASVQFNAKDIINTYTPELGTIITLKYISNIITLPVSSNLIKL